MLVYECLMIMLMLCKSSYARLTPRVLQAADCLSPTVRHLLLPRVVVQLDTETSSIFREGKIHRMNYPSDQNFFLVVVWLADCLSDFRLHRENNSVYVDHCLDKLSWFVECLSGFHMRHVNNSVLVDRCLDKLSWFVECLSGFHLRHVNNSG